MRRSVQESKATKVEATKKRLKMPSRLTVAIAVTTSISVLAVANFLSFFIRSRHALFLPPNIFTIDITAVQDNLS